MFKIESYITPIIINYIDKYVKDFRPQNAQVNSLTKMMAKPAIIEIKFLTNT